jgi:hypothetical protein
MAFDPRLAARVRAALPGAEEKQMFGGVCFLRAGHMVVGVMGDGLLVRVGKAHHDAALAEHHVRPMTFTGRVMRGFVIVDAEGVSGRGLKAWIARAEGFVAGLPDKRATRVEAAVVDELFGGALPAQRRLLEAARARIFELVPEVVEKARSGWKLLGYNAPSYFAYLGVVDESDVRLGFEWGVMLSDPARLLEGEGKQVRHVTLFRKEQLRARPLADLIRAAAALRPPRR